MTRSTTVGSRSMLAILAVLGCERATGPTPDATLALEATAGASVQVATVNTAVAQAPAFRVIDAAGRPVPGRLVRFVITQGHGTLEDSTAVTDGDGVAGSGNWILGRRAGPQQVFAYLPSATGNVHVTFNATSQPASPVRLALAPRTASVTVGDTLQLAWSHLDAFDNPIPAPPTPNFTALDPAQGSVDAAGRVVASTPGNARFAGAIGAHIDTLRTYAYRRAAPNPYDSFQIGSGAVGVATAANGSSVLMSDDYYAATRLFRVGPRATFAFDSVTLPSNSQNVAVSTDGTRAYFLMQDLYYGGAGIGVLDLGTMKVIGKFGAKGPIGGFSSSPDGSLLFVGVSVSTAGVISSELRIFQTNGDGSLAVTTSSPALVAVARPDNTRVWASLYDGTMLEVDLQTVSVVRAAYLGAANGLSLSPDGTRLYKSSAAGVEIVDLATFVVSAPIPGTDAATDVKVTPDGSKLIVARNHTDGVLVIDASTLAHVATYSGVVARRIALDTGAGHAIITGPAGTVLLIKY